MSDLPRRGGSPIDASKGCSMGEQSLMQGGRTMGEDTQVFVGIDVAKLRNAFAIAEPGRDGEVRYFGEVDASESSMRQLIKKRAARHDKLSFLLRGGTTGVSPSPADHGDGTYVHMRPRMLCAVALPCSAAKRNHFAAST